ncbi:MAG TPA: hypothetical protein VIK39_04385 [Candidatus Angelobacter sp.]
MAGAKQQRSMIKLSVYLYRKCTRAQQEGVIVMNNPPNGNKQLQFNYLDSIPAKVREHLKSVGLTYDVADNSDDTVIVPKSRKSKVVQKIRRGSPQPRTPKS